MRCGPLLACFVLGATVSTAMADFSTVNTPPSPEANQGQIISNAFGGTFVASGMNYTNNSSGITATRVEDTFNASATPNPTAPLSLTGDVGNDDQVWLANYQSASAKAIFAAFNQQFGYFLGSSPATSPDSDTYHNLFNDTGSGFGVTGSASLTSLSGQTLRWARAGTNRIVSSLNTDNADDMDHMVTYRIDGLSDESTGVDTWLVFFEDVFSFEGSDFDYNDLVVEIKATPIPSNTPEPTAAGLLLVGGMMALAKRRK
ncbi:MAG TPA: PEP-CTERM sorting domain-containing protein [Tepidisphaeraceae bacterium]|jgi:hypothetical protein